MIDFWTFLGQFFASDEWYLLSGILAGLVIIFGLIGIVFGAAALCDYGRGWWNLLFIPVSIVVVFFIVMLLAWSAMGHS